jgi:thymidylate synthase (FAD)
MRIVKQEFQLLTQINKNSIYGLIEHAGRTCYKTEDRQSATSAEDFVRILIARGHESVIEHASLSFKFITDRGVSHELVRHRIASYSQESTRYCNYSKDKFSNEVTFVLPHFIDTFDTRQYSANLVDFIAACQQAEAFYFKLLENGLRPQDARQVLNNAVKTEVVATFNMRSLRNMLRQRCARTAHPQMQLLMRPLLETLAHELPALFEDIKAEIDKTNPLVASKKPQGV